ncbi:MAG: hypothetical protein ACLPL7_06065, partial [Pseudomonas sp.]
MTHTTLSSTLARSLSILPEEASVVQDAPSLGSPFVLPNGCVLKNRLVKAAMSEQLGDRRHNPSPGLPILYQQWAEGGIGLSISGNIMVDRQA